MSLLRLASTFHPWSAAYCAMILPPYRPCSSPESAEYTSVAGNLYLLSTRAVSISAETPDASSLAPGASPVASITSLRRESRWPVITITRSGSLVPRWMATTFMTSTPSFGVRLPVNTCDGVTISRQPPQSFEIASKRDFTQRRAAPMPRALDLVSDKVLRVPKPTSFASISCSDCAETALATEDNSEWTTDGDVSSANATGARTDSPPARVMAAIQSAAAGDFLRIPWLPRNGARQA